MSLRPTSAFVNLNALRANARAISELLPSTCEVMAVIKADAYGHGAIAVAQGLLSQVARFGVATIEEGIELRKAGITHPILVLGGLLGQGEEAAAALIDFQLTPVMHSTKGLEILQLVAARKKNLVSLHLKIDTGMSRLGVMLHSLPSVIETLQRCPDLKLSGVMTHFPDANHEEETREQLKKFQSCRLPLEQALGEIPVWHAANSSAVLRHEALTIFPDRTTWVRPGLALYGIAEKENPCALQPVMSLTSRIALTKTIPAGTRVSYGGVFVAPRATRVAVVPIGYADGYPWRCQGKAHVLIHGNRVPVIGRITMDMIMCDVTDCAMAKVGDEVVLLGSQSHQTITVSEMASWAETIPYEILCGISKRMPRVYTEKIK